MEENNNIPENEVVNTPVDQTPEAEKECCCPSCQPQNPEPAKTDDCRYQSLKRSVTTLMACNIVLLVALVVLFVLHFTGKGAPSKFNPNASEPMIAEDGVLKVAYVNSDTLLAKYQYAIDLQNELNRYKEAQEKNYQEQMMKFQNDYQNFIKTGENMTLSQQQAKETELKQRAEKLATLEQELAGKVMQKQMDSNIELLNRIFAFVREYNADNQQFDIILRKTFNDSPTLYMNPAMDITDEILEGLNNEYKTVKEKK